MAGGGLGLVATVPIIGGMIKNPWAEGPESPLWVTLWRPVTLSDGTVRKVRFVQANGTPISPRPGSPGGHARGVVARSSGRRQRPPSRRRCCSRLDRTPRSWSAPAGGYELGRVATPTPRSAAHVGCRWLPSNEASRILCPCRQSQFDVTDGAKPVFGPAARPLPQAADRTRCRQLSRGVLGR